jgi:nucleoside-diphosphate-sugar epimerase
VRVALTGAAGFIGQHLRRALEARGDTVIGSDLGDWNGLEGLDLRDGPSVSSWLCDARPDAVIHAGAISGAMLARDNPDLVLAVNARGTANILAGLERCAANRLVFLSSIAVYAARADRSPVPETSALGSASAYGRSKIEAEGLIHQAAGAGRLASAAVLRISSVYGPHRRTPYMIGELPRHAATGLPAEVTDERCNMRQFVHVDDATRAVLLALDRATEGFVPLNVSGGAYLSERAIVEMAAPLLPGLAWRIVEDKEPGDGAIGPLELSLAGRVIGYAPQIPIETGLKRLFAG